MAHYPHKIVSGGQTGADRAALDAALAAGFPCGGWCPAGRRAEDGPIPPRYPVQALAGGYADRTLANVRDSDGTAVFFAATLHGGTALTRALCRREGKPHVTIDSLEMPPDAALATLTAFCADTPVAVLNVAGPRASSAPQIYAYVRQVIGELVAGSHSRPRQVP